MDGHALPEVQTEQHDYRFQPGATIAGRYKVIEALGSGGFAEVYLCQDQQLPRQLAIKVFVETGVELREGIAARLEHPNIIYVIDVSQLEDRTPIIIYRYVDGETLEKRLNEAQYHRLPLDEDTLAIIRQIGYALDYAHEKDVVHRDIKPSNIILAKNGRAFLTDFGLAELKRPSQGTSMLSVDVQQRLSGTLPYMAPEQFKEGISGNEQSDLYSLGVVAYEMLTGQLPYRGRHDTNLIYQIASAEPLPPKLANPELPSSVETVLLKVLSKDPGQRYSSCTAFVNELDEASRTFVQANDQYEQARSLLANRRWREALTAFAELERQEKGFKDTPYYLEQAQHQVKLLDLYERAEEHLKHGRFQDVLDTIKVLRELDPDYPVQSLYDQAVNGRARLEQRRLEEQYQQAVDQFNQQNYQAVLDTLQVIHTIKPDYPDTENIGAQAKEHITRQEQLRKLYNEGVASIRQERWQEAADTFLDLRQKAPGYEDVDTRLTMVRHLHRLSTILKTAETALINDEYTPCIDAIDELRRLDETYKPDAAQQLRREAVNRMQQQITRLLQQEDFAIALDTIQQLRQREPNFEGLNDLERDAREGVRNQKLRERLDTIYAQAKDKVQQGEHAAALTLWQQIQQEKQNLTYADSANVSGWAKDGLYAQAITSLSHHEPGEALGLWQQIAAADPHFVDREQVQERAEQSLARRRAIRTWAVRGGTAVLLVLVVLIFIWAIGNNNRRNDEATRQANETATALALAALPTGTFTPTTTQTPSATPTQTNTPTTTPTPSATATASQTPTPTPSHTPTPTPTATPGTIATAFEAATIYAEPDSDSGELGTILFGQSVPVLGRSETGNWLLVRTEEGIEGYVAANRFNMTEGSLPTTTATATPSPAATIDLSAQATARQEAGIYIQPTADSTQLGFVVGGDVVAILGRAASGSWLYIHTQEGIEGFVAANRFTYSVDFNSLPIVTPLPGSTDTSSSTINGTPFAALTIDLWPLPGNVRCASGQKLQSVYINGNGGNGFYTYYWEGNRVGGPIRGSVTFEVNVPGGRISGTGRVESGDGQSAEKIIFLDPVTCP